MASQSLNLPDLEMSTQKPAKTLGGVSALAQRPPCAVYGHPITVSDSNCVWPKSPVAKGLAGSPPSRP